jgi:hypothetical protein
MAPKHSRVHFYGTIKFVRPLRVRNKRTGYKVIIQTTVQVEHMNRFIPVYFKFLDVDPAWELYAWYKECHLQHREAPVLVTGRKTGHEKMKNEQERYRMALLEPSPEIIWEFLSFVKVIPAEGGAIPLSYQNVRICQREDANRSLPPDLVI